MSRFGRVYVDLVADGVRSVRRWQFGACYPTLKNFWPDFVNALAAHPEAGVEVTTAVVVVHRAEPALQEQPNYWGSDD